MPFYEPEFEEDEDQPARRRCRHIFPAGRRCGSPCLRTEQFCYHHHTTRRPVADPKARRARTDLFDLPEPEDREAIRAAVAQIMRAIAHNAIDLKRAGMLLYSLQISLCTFPPQPRPAPSKTATNSIPIKDIAEDIVVDETHGVIAPEAEYEPPAELKPRKSLGRQLLEEVERYEARQAAEAANAAAMKATEAAEKTTESGAPYLDSEMWASPSPQTSTEAAQKAAPTPPAHRPPAIDLRAAAEPEDCRSISQKRHPDSKKCHPDLTKHCADSKKCPPERSLARTCAKRSRRIPRVAEPQQMPGAFCREL